MLEVEQCYKVLDLLPGASVEEIHQSYKELAIVWHPDRFSAYPGLQQKAKDKFQVINEAHEQLRSLKRTLVATVSSCKSHPQDFTRESEKRTRERKDVQDYTVFPKSSKDVDMWLD